MELMEVAADVETEDAHWSEKNLNGKPESYSATHWNKNCIFLADTDVHFYLIYFSIIYFCS